MAPQWLDWNNMPHLESLENKLVVLIGGGGFLGRNVAQELLRRGARLRIADRHPEKAFFLKPLANLGQIQFAACDVTKPETLAAVLQGADAAAYLVGSFGADQYAVQAEGAGKAAAAAAAAGVRAFTYVSSVGADAASDSGYAGSKGQGEELVRAAFPTATLIRPSILFGEGDQFLNMFAGLIRALPAVPVFGAEAKLQPVWVDDAAMAVALSLADAGQHAGKTYEIAGPEQLTMLQLHERIAAAQNRQRSFIAVPDALASFFAALPGTPMSTDQWNLLKAGNVASGSHAGLEAFAITPRPLDLFLDRWMTRFRKYGRFSAKQEAA